MHQECPFKRTGNRLRNSSGALRTTALDVRKNAFEIRFLFYFKDPLPFSFESACILLMTHINKSRVNMIKVPNSTIEQMEKAYEGITEQIWRFENAQLPPCPHCGSEDTASVQVGIIGRTMHLVAATTKIHPVPNSPIEGKYFCNACRKYFDEEE